MIRQQLKNAKKAMYEMSNFCEQFGLPPIAPSRRHRKKPDKFLRKRSRHTKRRYVKSERPNKIFRKHRLSKNVKPSKRTCFNCGKKGHTHTHTHTHIYIYIYKGCIHILKIAIHICTCE
jgi:hypothetical protein